MPAAAWTRIPGTRSGGAGGGTVRDGYAGESLWRVRGDLRVAYEVVLTTGLLEPANPTLAEAGSARPDGGPGRAPGAPRRCVVVERRVFDLYRGALTGYFGARDVDVRWLVLDSGEEHKALRSLQRIIDWLDSCALLRREAVLAVGGGVLTDLVGFACSMYRRGLPYVRVPTTLVGLIDAGIGVKTGINYRAGKNRLGSYYPPVRALLDRGFLATLDDRHIANGLAEILKIGLVVDPGLFTLLESYGPLLAAERLQGHTPQGERAAVEAVHRAVGGMLDQLEPNLWEEQLERLVDYGHSLSPGLELAADPPLLHGEAVAIDMALTTLIARRRGLLSGADTERVLAVIRSLGLPVTDPVCRPELLSRALADVVRHRNGRQRLPLPDGIGSARFVDDLTVEEIVDAAQQLQHPRSTPVEVQHA